MRGEHYARLIYKGLRKGSSPHARGALKEIAQHENVTGIIPACAGSTLRRRPSRVV